MVKQWQVAICYLQSAISYCYLLLGLLLALLLCYCYLLFYQLAIKPILLLFYCAIDCYCYKENIIVNALKEYLRTNKIKNSTLATEMGVTTVTMCNAIAEKTEFRAKNLKVLLDYCVPFEIIRERMKRLYDEKRIAEKYGNRNAETETESETEAEFETETETWD